MSVKNKQLKIIGISGSPRGRNTNYMLQTVLDASGCYYEIILLKDKKIKPCAACGGCYKSHKCVVNDDMQELYEKLPKADIIILASPTFFANVTGIMKNFIDRCLPLYLSEKLKGKKAVLLTVGNFRKDEVRYLDNFDIEKAMKNPASRRKLGESIRRCLNIMKIFCQKHMKMKVIGSVYVINGDPESKKKELIKLGRIIANK
ncbi:MAG: flavodoxin family protein [Candidatus Pacebacteria bacterium]|nr:flavodoxin family protein [Candidatus Paceibacterota bacterium]